MTNHPVKVFALARGWGAGEYSQLLSLADGGSHLLLACRSQFSPSSSRNDVLRRLQPALIRQWEARSWPGTQLWGNDAANVAVLRKYQLNATSLQVLGDVARELWDWVEPRLPEDLCFLRAATGRPWFVSITHERNAYFKLGEDDRRLVESAFGADSLKCEGADPAPHETY